VSFRGIERDTAVLRMIFGETAGCAK